MGTPAPKSKLRVRCRALNRSLSSVRRIPEIIPSSHQPIVSGLVVHGRPMCRGLGDDRTASGGPSAPRSLLTCPPRIIRPPSPRATVFPRFPSPPPLCPSFPSSLAGTVSFPGPRSRPNAPLLRSLSWPFPIAKSMNPWNPDPCPNGLGYVPRR